MKNNLSVLQTESTIDLTTLARVKLALDTSGGTTWASNDDTVLEAIIDMVSRLATLRMGRGVKSQQRTEYFDVYRGQSEFFVLGSPIDTASSITANTNGDEPRVFTGTAINAKYIYPSSSHPDPARAQAGIFKIKDSLYVGEQTLKITYTGGMATSTANFITAYPDISQAIDAQCADMWLRRNSYGLQTQGVAGASWTYTAPMRWLPWVEMTLARYARTY